MLADDDIRVCFGLTLICLRGYARAQYCIPEETISKGLGEMGSGGGWFRFESVRDAYGFYQSQKEKYVWQPCKICRPAEEILNS